LPAVGLSVLALGVVALPAASAPATSAPAVASAPTSLGSDISWPQCNGGYPPTPAFGIVGANDGRPDTANPCLASEDRWARSTGTVEFYMNTANPGVAAGAAYTYGFNAARDAYRYATGQVDAGPGHTWWLDVETGNSWSADQGANTAVIAGSIAFLQAQRIVVGVYSTRYQWGVITGGASIPSVPNWVPGAVDAGQAPSFCAPGRSFSGGPVAMTQYTAQFDDDYLCPGVSLPAPLPPGPPPNPLGNLVATVLAWLNL
jgi:hypothetical protein